MTVQRCGPADQGGLPSSQPDASPCPPTTPLQAPRTLCSCSGFWRMASSPAPPASSRCRSVGLPAASASAAAAAAACCSSSSCDGEAGCFQQRETVEWKAMPCLQRQPLLCLCCGRHIHPAAQKTQRSSCRPAHLQFRVHKNLQRGGSRSRVRRRLLDALPCPHIGPLHVLLAARLKACQLGPRTGGRG